MKINEAIKRRIFQLCDQKNITVNKLAIISGVSPTTVRNIVGSRNSSPTIATIKKICDGLDMDIIDFFSDDVFRSLEQEIE